MDFETWFGEHRRWLLRLATALCGPDDAEDVAQEVLIKVRRRWSTIAALDHPQAYVRRMVINEQLSLRRRLSRIVVRSELVDLDPSPDPADRLADRSQLISELRRLPPKQRAVVVLRYVEDLDDAAIATALGCGPSTVRSHATRALATLRVQLTEASTEHEAIEEATDAH